MRAETSLGYAAIALLIAALVHIAGLLMGPDAIAFLGAPDEFVQGARNGDWAWTAFITLSIAALLGVLAWLSWQARPPNLSPAFSRAFLWLFAAIFTVRGMLVGFFVPAIMARNIGDPALFWFHVGASIFVLTIGVALIHGLYKTRAKKT